MSGCTNSKNEEMMSMVNSFEDYTLRLRNHVIRQNLVENKVLRTEFGKQATD